MRVLLVDDEPPARERLEAFFATMADVEVIGSAANGLEANAAIAALKPDLVMLDIQMPELSGLAVAAALPFDNRPEIVFVTAFEHFAPDAFQVEAADYLLKPVRFDRLRQAVDRARRRQAGRLAEGAAGQKTPNPYDEALWVPTRNGQVRVPVPDIYWIEAAGDYVMLHTSLRSYLYRSTMAALAKRIDPSELMRVHRSSFVRLSKVSEVQREGRWVLNLLLEDGVTVPVGPNYASAVLEQLGG
jgi:DNA-binding LytR/AlgR family response regulator